MNDASGGSRATARTETERGASRPERLQGAGAPPGGQRGAAPNQYRSADARERACASYDAILKRWPVPYEARLLETRFGDTHVITFGAEGARPLVLLHGLGTNATSWFPLVPALAARHRVHAIDTIGDVGKSAGTRPSYRSGDHARWLDQVLDALGVGSVALAGLSAGGWIALHFALAHPQRVERLALLAPASLQRMRAGMMLRGAFAMTFNRASVVRRLFRYLAAQEAPVMPEWAMQDVILRFQLGRPSSVRIPVVRDAELAALRVPALLMLGRNDPIYDATLAANRVRAVAPQIRIELIPDGGHLFVSHRPADTSKALLEFFGP
ncbi:alpha/beta fold hydrolase [Anaeromyxobacter oryzisoli]|uniref:alpha/beta fold hydrolase n=1 Tax=Anaeromyxobacter oryzisoli TaxID=2925408 RepID=UPI001F5894D0|nr:alpha/beta fold hydrolase [Anaeromyxobacter sp. SG63]